MRTLKKLKSMSGIDEKFRKVRIDQSPYLFHFTSGSFDAAKAKMYNILDSKKLVSSTGVICFTASPITSIIDFFKTPVKATGLPMYQPFGIGFSRDLLIRDYAARNVIYSSEEELSSFPPDLRWRSLRLDVGCCDFEYLREWRIHGSEFDFSSFPREQILIVAPNPRDLNDLIVAHDIVLRPVETYDSVELEEEEAFLRSYRGMSIEEIASEKSDYAVSATVSSQSIGEDMLDSLVRSHLCVLEERVKK